MKKSNFVAMILGTVAAVFFSLGMCMALLPEWDAFTPGVVLGSVGIILGLITIIVWRKMEHKPPIKLSGKKIGLCLYIIAGAIVLGAGMALCLVWYNYILGTIIGLAGIIMLMALIPIIKGIK